MIPRRRNDDLRWYHYAIGVPIAAGLILGLGALVALAFQYLWWFTLVPLFGLPELSFLQAWGLIILIGIIGSAFRSSKR